MNLEFGLTVVLTTYNRAESLRLTLGHYLELDACPLPWELLVVDNNSSDHTPEVIESFKDKLPIRYQLEKNPGQCEARNNGIHNGNYEVKIFTDDDVTPSARWLAAYGEAVVANPDVDYFGGPIEVDLSATGLPDWATDGNGEIADWIKGSFAYFDEAAYNRHPGHFYGGNMAYRQSVFDRFGVFDPRLGHTGSRRLATEETYLQRKLIDSGVKSHLVSDALVWHRIRSDEMTIKSRLDRMLWTGRGNAQMRKLLGEDTRLNLRRTGNALWYTIRVMANRRRYTPAEALFAQSRLKRMWGYERQMWNQLFNASLFKSNTENKS